MNGDPIIDGYILLPWKLSKSEIMDKPPLYFKLWIWMLIKASFKDHGNLKRGQFFTTFKNMQDAMSYKVGYRTEKPTKKQIRDFMDYLTKNHMAVTTKVTTRAQY